jgi:hypothetical protein
MGWSVMKTVFELALRPLVAVVFGIAIVGYDDVYIILYTYNYKKNSKYI